MRSVFKSTISWVIGETMPERARRSLRAYQRKALYYTLKRQHCALFIDMRLGKSLISIRSVNIRFKSAFKALIVSPYSAFNSWINEFEKENLQNEFIALTGTRTQRVKALSENKTFYLINREGWLVLPEIAKISWDAMIVDESTFLKSPPKMNKSSKHGKRPNTSRFFAENFRGVKHRYILTGTPMPEKELDIYMQLKFLDSSILPFEHFWSFRNKFFINMGYDGYVISEKGKKYLASKLAEHCFFLSRKDVNLGGEKIYNKRIVKMPNNIREIYNGLISNFIIENKEQIFNVTDNSAVKFVWARQLCGGFLHKENGELVNLWQGKINEVLELIRGELKNDKIVIWADFTAEILQLYEVINNQTKRRAKFINGSVKQKDRHKIVQEFGENKISILICQPGCFQYGADLSCADIAIYFSSPLSYEKRLQSEDRIVAVQNNSNLYIDIIVEDTIEEDIYLSIMCKDTRQKMWKRIMKRLQETK